MAVCAQIYPYITIYNYDGSSESPFYCSQKLQSYSWSQRKLHPDPDICPGRGAGVPPLSLTVIRRHLQHDNLITTNSEE